MKKWLRQLYGLIRLRGLFLSCSLSLSALLFISYICLAVGFDFTTFTEVDTESRLTVTANKVEFFGLENDDSCYVYYDLGTGNVSSNFTLSFDFQITSSDTSAFTYLVAMTDDGTGVGDADDTHHYGGGTVNATALYWDNTNDDKVVRLVQWGTGTSYDSDYTTIEFGQVYYCSMWHDDSVDTYGHTYVAFYSDANRQTLVDTINVENNQLPSYRYVYSVQSKGTTGTQVVSGFVANMIYEDYVQVPYYNDCQTGEYTEAEQNDEGYYYYVDCDDNLYIWFNNEWVDVGSDVSSTNDVNLGDTAAESIKNVLGIWNADDAGGQILAIIIGMIALFLLFRKHKALRVILPLGLFVFGITSGFLDLAIVIVGGVLLVTIILLLVNK